MSYVIVGAGGFVGLGKHDVAIPVNQLQEQDGKYVLSGATKEAIKALPKFEYAKKCSRTPDHPADYAGSIERYRGVRRVDCVNGMSTETCEVTHQLDEASGRA